MDYFATPYEQEFEQHYHQQELRSRPQPQPQSRPAAARRKPMSLWVIGGAVGFLVFALVYVTLGIRWHTHRARAAVYAQQEMEATFRAADYKRAARTIGRTEADLARAIEYRRLAEMCTRAAEEAAAICKQYEEAW